MLREKEVGGGGVNSTNHGKKGRRKGIEKKVMYKNYMEIKMEKSYWLMKLCV